MIVLVTDFFNSSHTPYVQSTIDINFIVHDSKFLRKGSLGGVDLDTLLKFICKHHFRPFLLFRMIITHIQYYDHLIQYYSSEWRNNNHTHSIL